MSGLAINIDGATPPRFRTPAGLLVPRPPPWSGRQASLAEVMDDPIVHLLMARDGVAAGEVWSLMQRVREGQDFLYPAGDRQRTACQHG